MFSYQLQVLQEDQQRETSMACIVDGHLLYVLNPHRPQGPGQGFILFEDLDLDPCVSGILGAQDSDLTIFSVHMFTRPVGHTTGQTPVARVS